MSYGVGKGTGQGMSPTIDPDNIPTVFVNSVHHYLYLHYVVKPMTSALDEFRQAMKQVR